MPFSGTDPEDLRTLVLTLAAASVSEPVLRARVARWLRAGLELVEDREANDAEAFAIREVAENLGMAAEHMSWLAKSAERITRRS